MQRVRNGNDGQVIWGAVGVARGGGGVGLNPVAVKLGLTGTNGLAGPFRAFGAADTGSGIALDVGTNSGSC